MIPKMQPTGCNRLNSSFLHQKVFPFRILRVLKYRYTAIEISCGVSLERRRTILLVLMSFIDTCSVYIVASELVKGFTRLKMLFNQLCSTQWWSDLDLKVGKIGPLYYLKLQRFISYLIYKLTNLKFYLPSFFLSTIIMLHKLQTL